MENLTLSTVADGILVLCFFSFIGGCVGNILGQFIGWIITRIMAWREKRGKEKADEDIVEQ